RGAAFVDVVSPCVAFNNHAGSTRSYDHVREHNEAVNRLDVIPAREAIEARQEAGGTLDVTQHDGSVLRLHRLDAGYDPRDRAAETRVLRRRQAGGELATGLRLVEPGARALHAHRGTVETPLNALGPGALCPGAAALDAVNASLR